MTYQDGHMTTAGGNEEKSQVTHIRPVLLLSSTRSTLQSFHSRSLHNFFFHTDFDYVPLFKLIFRVSDG